MESNKKGNLDSTQVSDSAINGKNLDLGKNQDKKKNLVEEFNQVWDLYPRKQGKKAAEAAFIKARRNGTSLESIISGIKSYLDYIAAKKISQEYVKQGSTFFNQEAWNDDWSLPTGYSFYNSKPNYDIEAYERSSRNIFGSMMDEERANNKEFVDIQVDDYDKE